jgi:hypothetical protein
MTVNRTIERVVYERSNKNPSKTLKQYFDLWQTCDDLANARTHVHKTFSSRSFLWAHAGNCSFSTVHKYLWVSTHSQDRHKNVILGPARRRANMSVNRFLFK